MITGQKYDLYSPEFRQRSYATFARLRREDPVFQQPGLDGETSIWPLARGCITAWAHRWRAWRQRSP